RLLDEQEAYTTAAARQMTLATAADPAATRAAPPDVPPAFTTLDTDVRSTASAFRHRAEVQLVELRGAQVRTFYGLILGFLCVLALVAGIWRTVLGYRRRLAAVPGAARRADRAAEPGPVRAAGVGGAGSVPPPGRSP